MNRQRIAVTRSARPAAISVGNAKPVLRSSTRVNQIKPLASTCMSYKELIRVVGVDCETGPSSWRKAIDHSAETVVFYQVDLRGTLPRMYKSVRIRREEGTGENKELRLVPSVYVGDTLLSVSYVKTIIGRRFLADEDDLMKLLEHAGILQEEEETMEVRDYDQVNDDWDADPGENDPVPTEPELKRVKTVANSRSAVRERGNKARSEVQSTETDSSSAQPTSSRRQAIDLSAMLLLDQIGQTPVIPKAVVAEEDTPMDTDFDGTGLPVADDTDDLPLGYNFDDLTSTTGTMETPHYQTVKEDTSERDESADKTERGEQGQPVTGTQQIERRGLRYTSKKGPTRKKGGFKRNENPDNPRTSTQRSKRFRWSTDIPTAFSSKSAKHTPPISSSLIPYCSTEWPIIHGPDGTGQYTFEWYWQTMSTDAQILLRPPYRIFVYKTVLEDLKAYLPKDKGDDWMPYAWRLIQHLFNGKEGLLRCYQHHTGPAGQGLDKIVGDQALTAVAGYVTELLQLAPMTMSQFKNIFNNKMNQIRRSALSKLASPADFSTVVE